MNPVKEVSYCDTLVETQVNGSEEEEEENVVTTIEQGRVAPEERDESQIFELEAPVPAREPTLELNQLGSTTNVADNKAMRSSTGSQRSADVSQYCNSNTSSYIEPPERDTDTPSTDVSTLDWMNTPETSNQPQVDLSSFDFGFSSSSNKRQPYTFRATPANPATYNPASSRVPSRSNGRTRRLLSVNAGTYSPSGAGQLSPVRALSTESVTSTRSSGSSVYPENSIQAAEIEEEELRGRRRLRALDHIPSFGIVDGEIRLPEQVVEEE